MGWRSIYGSRRLNYKNSLMPQYAPVMEFVFDGQTRQVAGSVYSSTIPQKGQIMQIGIDPQNISKARVKQKSSAVLAIIFMLAGALTAIAGIGLMAGGVK